MSRKVELLIRAKDEVSKTVDTIVDSLADFAKAQDDVVKSGAKTGGVLSALGRGFKELGDEAKRLESLGKVASTLERSSVEVKKLGSTVRESAEELAKLARASETASASATKLRNAMAAEVNSADAFKASQKAARVELDAVNKSLSESRDRLREYKESIKGIPTKKLAPEVSAKGAGIVGDIASDVAKQKQLRADVKAYGASLNEAKARVDALVPSLKAAESAETKFATEAKRSASELARSKIELNGARDAHAGIAAAADKASAAMGGMAISQESVTRAAARNAAELARTKAQIDGLGKTPATAVGADLSGDAKENAARRVAVERLRELRKEMVSAQIDATRLGAELAKTATPTEALGRAAGAAQSQIKQLKAEAADLTSRLRPSTSSFLSWSKSVDAVKTSAASAVPQIANLGANATKSTSGIRALVSSLGGVGGGFTSAAGGGERFRSSLDGIYGSSRQSLSMLQRVRGEVLSLVTAYIGLRSAINNIGGVITAFQTLEAAQNRLGAVFNQDTGKVAKELEWLERQASRLGIEFGVLADQYGKFSVATNSANYSLADTRKIFMSVAEAGRVNKLSVDQLSGVFLALEQMISKGKITSEELRRQMGDRLPGAFNIFANALGLTTAQLDKMMQKGEVLSTDTNMLKFADELNKKFGSQLGDALQSTTTEIGRWSNSIYNAQLLVAKGGFIEAFTKALRSMNEYFASREGRDFFLSLGAAMGRFIDVLAVIPKYFSEIKIGLALIAGAAAGRVVADMIGWFTKLAAASLAYNKNLGLIGPTTQQFAQSAGGMTQALSNTVYRFDQWRSGLDKSRTGMVALSGVLTSVRSVALVTAGVFRGLWAAIGGIPGIILTGVTIALGSWVTSVDDTTSAVDEHKRIMGEVISAYETVKGKTEEWGKAVKNVTLDQAAANLRKMIDVYEKSRKAVLAKSTEESYVGRSFSAATSGDASQAKLAADIKKVTAEFNTSDMSAKKYVATMEELYAGITDGQLKVYAQELLEAGRASAVAEEQMGNQAVAVKELGDTSQATADIVEKTGATIQKAAGEAEESNKRQVEGGEAVRKSYDEMGKYITKASEELQKLGKIDAIEKLYQDGLKAARTMGEIAYLTGQANKAISAVKFGDLGSDGLKAAVSVIKEFEGFAADAYPDMTVRGGQKVNSGYRAGYGSDTVTLADGSVKAITNGMTVSLVDATRDLSRRVGEFAAAAKNDIGANKYESFTAQQQAAITSIAYNYGSLGATGALKTFQTGTVEEIAKAIRGLASHNGGINAKRRNSEADLFEGGGESERVDRQLEVETKRKEKADEYNTSLKERLAIQTSENANAGIATKEAFVQKALADEIKRAKQADLDLTPEQIENIKQVAAAEWEVANAKREGKTEQAAANLASQTAVNLAAQRAALQKQFNEAAKAGDQPAMLTAQTELDAVNLKLQDAILNARQMWEAIGGPGADAALIKLDTLKIKADTASVGITSLGLTLEQVQQLGNGFADGLLGVFDSFANAIANGEDAMQALGQAFLQFAADFLREIAKMIIKQMILNALKSLGIPGLGTAHTGGVVGQGFTGTSNARTRGHSAAAGFLTYHTGGIAGFAPDEVNTVLKVGEEVITEGDPRHRRNGGLAPQQSSAPAPQAIRNIVVLDEDTARQMANSGTNEKAVIAFIKKNRATVKQLLG